MARDVPSASASHLVVANDADINISGTALSIAFWLYPDTVNGFPCFVVKGAPGSAGQFAIYGGDPAGFTNDLFTDIASGAALDSAQAVSALTLGSWQHVTMVKNGTGAGALKNYVDGVEKASITSNLSIQSTTSDMWFGDRPLGSPLPADGRLAEIGIWDKALTAAQVLALAKGAPPPLIEGPNLKGYWPLWGATSPESDLSGNSNSATIAGTVLAANHAPVGRLVPFAG